MEVLKQCGDMIGCVLGEFFWMLYGLEADVDMGISAGQ